MGYRINEWIKQNREILSYLFWGGGTTVVNWGSYYLLMHFTKSTIAVANTVSWVLAVLFAYLTNKWFVFRSREWNIRFLVREFGLFLSARALTGAFEIVAVPLLVYLGMNQQLMGADGGVSKVVVSVSVVVMNYFVSKFLIFKTSE